MMSQTRALSRTIARILGPTLLVLSVAEAVNLEEFHDVKPWFVFLNGNLLLVAGLAIVQSHNRWRWHWSVLNTVCGWMMMIAGIFRMFRPSAEQVSTSTTSTLIFILLGLTGLVLTWNGYRPVKSP